MDYRYKKTSPSSAYGRPKKQDKKETAKKKKRTVDSTTRKRSR